MRNCFFSFHYVPDNWRAATVRSIGVVDGEEAARDNDWESVRSYDDKTIKNWIDQQMKGRTCAIVLIGENTAGRPWINYEIETAWNNKLGLVGIHIHGLKNAQGMTSSKGANPFTGFTIGQQQIPLTNVVRSYDPPGFDSRARHGYIAENIGRWIEEGIAIRKQY